tara:strand:+ start:114 stop:239 length:126 start_codon:yes stop_codon:yes gene_type:complete
MILSKEHQEVMINKYLSNHTVAETKAYIDGMKAIVKLINKK